MFTNYNSLARTVSNFERADCIKTIYFTSFVANTGIPFSRHMITNLKYRRIEV